MYIYIALLRGINVSGRNKIKMVDLKNELTKIELHQVTTYIQSGNIIFKSSDKNPKNLEQRIQDLIRKVYSYEVPVLVMSMSYLEDRINRIPYSMNNFSDPSKYHLTFLSQVPDEEILKDLKGLKSSSDKWMYKDQTIYLHCPDGYGRTKFNNGFFEKKLIVQATTRNWKTCNKLLEMAKSL